MNTILKIMLLVFVLSGKALASEDVGFPDDDFKANMNDKISMQRGARLFINYCSGCHSLKYQRYNRLFEDLGIDPKVGKENLIFIKESVHGHINRAMLPEQGKKWLGVAPPDLSLVARARGGKWIYNYLRGFYVDEKHHLGMNNGVFPGANMPHALVELQGIQEPIYKINTVCDKNGQNCETDKTLSGFKLIKEGSMSITQYNQATYDIANFLTYVGDPSILKRMKIAPWVLIFIAFLTGIFYLLKREYWRGIH